MAKGKGDSGTPWVVSTSGLLPDNTGIQREMNSWGGGGNSSLLFSIYIKSESYIQINM